ncbi:MAG: DUF2267 domain-containing protein [Oceanicaulis sp.]
MADTNVQTLDQAVHTANTWLRDIQEAAGLKDRESAYRALRGVLLTIRERLPVEPASQLGAQLPTLIRGIYYEQFSPAHQPRTIRSKTEFLTLIAEEFDPVPELLDDPDRATQAVLSVVNTHIDSGEARKARHMLNDDLKELWPLAA